MAENRGRPNEAQVLRRFRKEWATHYLPPGGAWSDLHEGKRVGGVYIGKALLKAGDAAVSAVGAITGQEYRVPDGRRRGVFADATYTLGGRIWVFEIKTVLRSQLAWAVGAQAWLYREILAQEVPTSHVEAWVITTCFEGNRLYRRVFLEAFVEKLRIGFLFLDEGIDIAPRELLDWR